MPTPLVQVPTNNSTLVAIAAATAISVAGVVTSLTIGSTPITGTMAAHLSYSSEAIAYPEDFASVTLDGGPSTPDGGPAYSDNIDGGALYRRPYDGTINWRDAIQAALNSMGSPICGKVKLRQASYGYLGAAMTVPKCVTLEGNAGGLVYRDKHHTVIGAGSSLINLGSTVHAALILEDLATVSHVNFGVQDSTVTPTNAAVIDGTNAYGWHISDVRIYHAYDAIRVNRDTSGPINARIDRVDMMYVYNAGYYMKNAVDWQVHDGVTWNPTTDPVNVFSGKGYGFHLVGGSETWAIEDWLSEEMKKGIQADGGHTGAATMLHWGKVINSTLDMSTEAGMVISGGLEVDISHNHFSGGNYGLYIYQYNEDVNVVDNVFEAHAYEGIHLEDSTDIGIRIAGNTLKVINPAGGTCPAGGACAAIRGENVQKFAITDNHCELTTAYAGWPAGQFAYCVQITGASSDHYIITGNYGAGASGVVSDTGGGADKYVRNP